MSQNENDQLLITQNNFQLLHDICEHCNKLNCSCIMHDTERTISDYTSHLHGQSKEECISTKVTDEHLFKYSYTQTGTDSVSTVSDFTLNSDTVTNDDTCSDYLHARSDSSMSAPQPLNLNLEMKGLKIGHLNVQGIQNKLDQLNLMLNNSHNDIHILGTLEILKVVVCTDLAQR